MIFKDFKDAIQRQFASMEQSGTLVRMDVDKDLMWDTYLSSFPTGSNPIYKERTEHDCQACRSFIRSVGNLAAIVGEQLVSIWDTQLDGPYQVVADAMGDLVLSADIKNLFLITEKRAGINFNQQMIESGEILTWEHFYIELPSRVVVPGIDIGGKLSDSKSTFDVFKRGLEEITVDAIDTVLELIDQNSLYRGEENRHAISKFAILKQLFTRFKTCKEKDIFCWQKSESIMPTITRIRNTAIGTLLVDISTGVDLNYAVRAFESKVAPINYKRPTALITKGMVQKAEQKVEELGFTTALQRRFATTEDITINNILFADRAAKQRMNVFAELSSSVPENLKSLDKVDEVTIDTFINSILPKAESIELLLENSHIRSMVSLVAPVDSTAKNILKWHNNFSWAYAGDLTDSIKERVKAAGGDVTGDLRCSLSWFNKDDLDIHLVEPNGDHIYFSDKISSLSGGELDVDMNATSELSRTPVENITFPSKQKMQEGNYKLFVHNYCRRESVDIGFAVEIEFNGIIHSFHYNKAVANNENVTVAKFNYSRENGITIIKSLPSTQMAKQAWNLATQKFHKVSMVMNSPNYWDEKATGNKHYFFMLEDCLNPDKARGFFNEFLTEELREHRKVFEVLGSKMKTEQADNQLSGLGFSSTQRNHVFCKVAGSFARTVKIIF